MRDKSPTRRRHVLYYLPATGWGGVENYTIRMANEALRRGWESTIAVASRTDDPGRVQFLAHFRLKALDGVRTVLHVCTDRIAEDRGSVAALFRRHAPTLVHFNHANPQLAFHEERVALRMGIPYVTTDHGGADELWRPAPGVLEARRETYSGAAACIAVSQSVADNIARGYNLSPGLFHVIRHGLAPAWDPSRALESRGSTRVGLGVPDEALIVCCVSRLDILKGQDVLLRACALLGRLPRPVYFLLVGDGVLRERLEQLAVNRGIADRVLFVGETLDVFPFLYASDLFVFPTLSEALGIVLLEAMSCGLPVIASRVGGVPEVIENGINGILVPPDDEISLAEAMRGLLHSAERRRSLGEAALRRMREAFPLSETFRRTFELYDRPLHGRN